MECKYKVANKWKYSNKVQVSQNCTCRTWVSVLSYIPPLMWCGSDLWFSLMYLKCFDLKTYFKVYIHEKQPVCLFTRQPVCAVWLVIQFAKGSINQNFATAERECICALWSWYQETSSEDRGTGGQGQEDSTGFVLLCPADGRRRKLDRQTDSDRQGAGESRGLEAEQAKMSNLSALQQLFNICCVPIRALGTQVL